MREIHFQKPNQLIMAESYIIEANILREAFQTKMSQIVEKVKKGGVSAKIKIIYISNVN